MRNFLKILFVIANIGCGAYLMYDGWHRGGIYLLTVFFSGAVMFSFGIVFVFVGFKEKKKPLL